MRRALVTGATGLLGGYLVERLVAAGWSVRGLARHPAGDDAMTRLGAEAVRGDLTDGGSLRVAARGCDAIFHAAAVIGSRPDWAIYRLGNVVGTEHVVSAAESAGSRLVHVSSTAVFGPHRYFTRATDETTPLPELPRDDAYGLSKQQAERVVLGAHAEGRIWGSVVRPPIMYGKRDRQFAPRLGPVLELGFFPLVGDGSTTLPLVHAASVADGALRAATTDAAGGRVYHLTNDLDLTVADLVRHAAHGLGRRVRTPRLPKGAAHVASKALAAALFLSGRRDLVPHVQGLLDMLTRNNPFTSERARRELGWAPVVCPAEGLADSFRWWSEHRGAGREAV